MPPIMLDPCVISSLLQITSVLALLATMAGVALYMDPEVISRLTLIDITGSDSLLARFSIKVYFLDKNLVFTIS